MTSTKIAKAEAKVEAERIRSLEYWQSSRTWFEEQGYFLYELVNIGKWLLRDEHGEYARPTRDYPDTPPHNALNPFDLRGVVLEDPFPYAFMGPRDTAFNRPTYSSTHTLRGPTMYAQDTKGRHIVIKKLKNEEEYRILRLLKDHPRLQDPNSFLSIIPILDLLQHDGHWFAVMPRWGENLHKLTFFPTFHIAIRYIISLLEGLAFLHGLRIFHRDLCYRNTLVNHFSGVWSPYLTQTSYHHHLHATGAIKYAIMDFDIAMILDEETYGSNPRLPIELVRDVDFGARPYEIMHAYVDFDPFKYDVACLGIEFSHDFQQIIGDVPLLAPLIDRMITSDIDKRFTASEALAFARNILPTVSPHDRFDRVPDTESAYYNVDIWAGLPESFIAEWGSYREDYSSWSMRLQNRLFVEKDDWTPGWYMMYYCRYTVHIFRLTFRFGRRHILSMFKRG